jgi:Zn-dependent protease
MYKLGKLFGVRVYLHWSLAILAFILLPTIYPIFAGRTHNELLAGALSLVLCVGVVASILWHELAHSLVGRHFSYETEKITLLIFGGIASIRGNLRKPSEEFWVIIAGPISSIVLGVGFFVLSFPFYFCPTIALFLSIMASVNIVLGIANLFPLYPCDGGRVLRAIVWKLTGSQRKATMFAGTIGKGFAGLFVLAGLIMAAGFTLPVLGGGMINGLWTAFIGVVLYMMAANEVKIARIT